LAQNHAVLLRLGGLALTGGTHSIIFVNDL
jgi:hypothetical protein